MKKEPFNKIDCELLHELFLYDKRGYLIWRERKPSQFKGSKWQKRNCKIWNSNHAGKIAGYNCEDRYIVISFNGHMYGAHRLIYAYHFGDFTEEIDHININGLDNVGLKASNKTGVTGILFDKSRGKWRSQIAVSGKQVFLGRFDNLNEAVLRRYEAEIKYGYLEILNESSAHRYLIDNNLLQ